MQDLRFAPRLLYRGPASLSWREALALGIGASSAIAVQVRRPYHQFGQITSFNMDFPAIRISASRRRNA
jgi:hypothetical protein